MGMNSVIIFGIHLSCMHAKEEMMLLLEYLKGEGIHICDILTQESILENKSNPNWIEMLGRFDQCLFHNRKMLEAGGVTDEKLADEMDRQTLWRMFYKHLHKTRSRVFLVSNDEEIAREVKGRILQTCHGELPVNVFIINPAEEFEANLVNEINMAAPEVVLTILPSGLQEQFIVDHMKMLNTRLLIGCPADHLTIGSNTSMITKLKEGILGRFLRRERRKEQL